MWLRNDIFRHTKKKKEAKHLLTASNLHAAVLISPSFRKWEKIDVYTSLIFGCGRFFVFFCGVFFWAVLCLPLQVAQLGGKLYIPRLRSVSLH